MLLLCSAYMKYVDIYTSLHCLYNSQWRPNTTGCDHGSWGGQTKQCTHRRIMIPSGWLFSSTTISFHNEQCE